MSALKLPSVMIVDDEAAFAAELQERLEQEGFPSFSAHSGHDAISLLWSNPQVSMVVSDLSMPDLSGFDVMRIASTVAPHRKLKWVFVSGKAGMDDAIMALRSRAVDFFRKPVDPDEVVGSVRRGLADSGALVPERGQEPDKTRFANLAVMIEVARLAGELVAPELHSMKTSLAILLETLQAAQAGQMPSLTTVGLESEESLSTVTRRIHALIDSGLLVVVNDPNDQRRRLVTVNPALEKEAERVLTQLRRALADA